MESQGERLKQSHKKVKETQEAAQETRQLLSNMANKALRSKVGRFTCE
jgi:CHASE3 domain sensor protein